MVFLFSKPEEIQRFSEKFAVQPELVSSYISHWKYLTIQGEIRGRGRKEQKRQRMKKSVHEYDWQQLVDSGELKKLYVPELDKYLSHHGLSIRGSKPDKLKRITWHVLGRERERADDDADMDVDNTSEGEQAGESGSERDSSSDYDSEDDIVLAQLIQPSANSDLEMEPDKQHKAALNQDERLWSIFQSDTEEEDFSGFD